MKRAAPLLFPFLACFAAPARAAQAPVPAAQPASADARAQLDEILAKPAYHRWERRFADEHPQDPQLPKMKDRHLPRWLSNALEDFGDWLWRKLFDRGSGPDSASSSSGDAWFTVGKVLKVVFWAVLAGVVLLIGWFAARALLDARRGAPVAKIRPGAEKIRAALADGAALALAGEEWLGEADALAAGGDFRGAYRALYLALLSGLHEAGAIRFTRSRTNWTYVRDFKGGEADRGSFETLTGMFDQVWYGLSVPPDAAARLTPLQHEVARLIRRPQAQTQAQGKEAVHA